MTRRKILALLAFFACISAVYALAERQARRMQTTEAELSIDWDAVVDDPEERLEISWMSIPRFPTAREGTWIEKRLEARFNVDFKPLFTSHFAYMRRRPLVFAGGNVPDLFYAGDPVVVQKDAHHGYALPIPYEVIQKHAPNYVRYLNQYAPSTWLYAYWKGANYGIPYLGQQLRLSGAGDLENGLAAQRRYRQGAGDPRRDVRGAVEISPRGPGWQWEYRTPTACVPTRRLGSMFSARSSGPTGSYRTAGCCATARSCGEGLGPR